MTANDIVYGLIQIAEELGRLVHAHRKRPPLETVSGSVI